MLNSLVGSEKYPTDCEIRNPGLIENLQGQKASLEDKLAKVNAALKALQKYPEMVEVFQTISKLRF